MKNERQEAEDRLNNNRGVGKKAKPGRHNTYYELKTTFFSTKGYSLVLTIFAGAMVLITSVITATLLLSQFSSLANYKYASDAYMVAKAGVNVAVEDLNSANPTLTSTNPINGQVASTTNPSKAAGTYHVTFNGLTLKSKAVVTPADRSSVTRTVTVDLTSRVGNFIETFSTATNRANTSEGLWENGVLSLGRTSNDDMFYNPNIYSGLSIEAYNGKLYASFTEGPTSIINVFNGTSWQNSYAAGASSKYIYDLQVYNNKLYAAGGDGLYAFDGSVWQKKASSGYRIQFNAMTVYNGLLYIGNNDYWGCKNGGNRPARVYSYDGTTLRQISIDSEMRAGLNCTGKIGSLASFNGKLYVSGEKYALINNQGYNTTTLDVYNGTTWSYKSLNSTGLGLYNRYAFEDMKVFNNNLYAVGSDALRASVWRIDNMNKVTKKLSFGSYDDFHSLTIFNNELYAGMGPINKWNDARIYKTKDGSDWSLFFQNPTYSTQKPYYDFKGLTTFNNSLAAITEHSGTVEFFNYYKAQNILSKSINTSGKIKSAYAYIYPANGSVGQIKNFQLSNGGSYKNPSGYPAGYSLDTSSTDPIKLSFNFGTNLGNSTMSFRLALAPTDISTPPLIDKIAIRYISTKYNINYSTWRTD